MSELLRFEIFFNLLPRKIKINFQFQSFGENLNQFPKLKDWFERCKKLPGFDENLEGSQALAESVRNNLEEKLWP